MTKLTFRASEAHAQRLRELATRLGVPRSSILRRALEAYLAEEKAFDTAESWLPAEDWSDWIAWLDAREAGARDAAE